MDDKYSLPKQKTFDHDSQLLAILDAGAQYGKVIDRRIRELAVESVLLPISTPIEELQKFRALIISGGPESVYDNNAPKFDLKLFQLKIPILGICYGMQCLNYALGGTVERKATREDGAFQITVDTSSPLFSGLKEKQDVLLTHGDTVNTLAKGFKVTALSGKLIAAIEDPKRKLYGVQFHPEVDLTVHGKEIFSNFLFHIAGFARTYTMENREEKALAYIKSTVGAQKALCLVSGGVDSTTSAALVTKAIGKENVIALYIDTGFMRQNESELVVSALHAFGIEVNVIYAKDQFLHATTMIHGIRTKELRECTDPEEKRKIVGDMFITITQQALEKMNFSQEKIVLVQGSLRPDLIESASTTASKIADVIKTHHNDAPLVRKLREKGKIVEPLADYHKDEVRELATSLGIPEEIVWRQPFPGPGLSIRILCTLKPYVPNDFLSINAQLKAYETKDNSITLLPIRTVGVQGDGRSYSYLAGISGKPNWEELFTLAKEIPKKVHTVNRVVYVFGEKLTHPITEITPTLLTNETVVLLRQADDIVNQILYKHKLMKKLSQVPVILFPVSFGIPGNRSIAIRTLITKDFMTGVPAVPGKEMPLEALNEMVKRILNEVPTISRVAYDLTSKPPATTEWE